MKDIIAQFQLENEVGEPQAVKVGIINESYILPAKKEGGVSYFLQRINHHIFKDIEGLQHNIATVTDHLRRKMAEAGESDIARKALQLVPTHDGKLYYHTPEGEYWRAYVKIDRASSHEQVTPQSAELAGEAFGRFQCQLSDLPFSAVKESIPNFHNIAFRLEQLRDAIAADKAGRVEKTQAIIDTLLQRAEAMCLAERLFREGRLPKRINHCDTKVNNMLFDEDGKPLCIVDLDTVMPGFVLSDYGDFMRTAACTAAEDEPDVEKIHVDMAVFEAYTRGYLRTATFLTDIEKELLPFGVRLLSYMQAVRFLTDYLNGDTYYHIDYPEHNLVRTRAQVRLLEEQEKLEEEMRKCVNV